LIVAGGFFSRGSIVVEAGIVRARLYFDSVLGAATRRLFTAAVVLVTFRTEEQTQFAPMTDVHSSSLLFRIAGAA
jgi:hypothetical protein